MGGKGKELEGQGRAGQAKIHRVKPGKKMEPPALRSGMQDPPPLMSGQGGYEEGGRMGGRFCRPELNPLVDSIHRSEGPNSTPSMMSVVISRLIKYGMCTVIAFIICKVCDCIP